MIKKYIIILLLFVPSIMAKAQEKWSLRKCIDYAVENNIDIKQQDLKLESAEIDLSTSKNSRLPNLNGSASHNFNFGNSTSSATNGYISGNKSNTSFSIGSDMPLFTGFKIPNEIAAKQFDLKAATEGLQRAKDDLSILIASYYLDVLFKKEILKVYEEQAQLTSSQVEQTAILVESGKVAQSQLYDIKSQLATAELNIVTAKNSLDLSLLTLAQALNLAEYNDFDVEEPVVDNVMQENLSSIIPPDQIYNRALQIRPQIKEAEYNIESSKKTLKVAQSGYYPTLSLNLGYGTSSQRIYGMDNMDFKDQLRDFGNKYIGFSLSVPIFNRFQVRNQVRSARVNIRNAELAMDNAKMSLYKEIQQAYQNAIGAQAKFVATEKSVEASSESYKYAQEKYKVGKSSVYELNEAETKLIGSRSDQIQAKYDFLFRSKILDFYAGKEIELK